MKLKLLLIVFSCSLALPISASTTTQTLPTDVPTKLIQKTFTEKLKENAQEVWQMSKIAGLFAGSVTAYTLLHNTLMSHIQSQILSAEGTNQFGLSCEPDYTTQVRMLKKASHEESRLTDPKNALIFGLAYGAILSVYIRMKKKDNTAKDLVTPLTLTALVTALCSAIAYQAKSCSEKDISSNICQNFMNHGASFSDYQTWEKCSAASTAGAKAIICCTVVILCIKMWQGLLAQKPTSPGSEKPKEVEKLEKPAIPATLIQTTK